MQDSIHPQRLTRLPRARVLALATLVSGVLVAGCGGSSRSPRERATRSDPTAPSAGGSGVAFSKCMRSNGVGNFPDPLPGGGLRLQLGAGINPSSPAFEAAQAACKKLLPNGGPPGPGSTTHPSAQTLAKLLNIARCMRRHGISQFPDPGTSVPLNLAGQGEVTDFDGAILMFPRTINVQSPAYTQAAAACGALAQKLGRPH